MKEYDLRKAILAEPKLTANEKLVLFGMMIRLDWNSFSGCVSASNVSELISLNIRSVRRSISSLKEKKVIKRKSGSSAFTQINLNYFRGDTFGSDTLGSDTLDTPKGDTLDTPKGDTFGTRSISNNYNQYSYQSVTQEHARNEIEEESKEREIKKVYSFVYPSSIKDPETRLRVENYIKANYHNLTQSEINRHLYPDESRANF
jgi:hypothetical protein